MAKRLVIDYGSDTLIDLDAPRQNLGQLYNLGGRVGFKDRATLNVSPEYKKLIELKNKHRLAPENTRISIAGEGKFGDLVTPKQDLAEDIAILQDQIDNPKTKIGIDKANPNATRNELRKLYKEAGLTIEGKPLTRKRPFRMTDELIEKVKVVLDDPINYPTKEKMMKALGYATDPRPGKTFGMGSFDRLLEDYEKATGAKINRVERFPTSFRYKGSEVSKQIGDAAEAMLANGNDVNVKQLARVHLKDRFLKDPAGARQEIRRILETEGIDIDTKGRTNIKGDKEYISNKRRENKIKYAAKMAGKEYEVIANSLIEDVRDLNNYYKDLAKNDPDAILKNKKLVDALTVQFDIDTGKVERPKVSPKEILRRVNKGIFDLEHIRPVGEMEFGTSKAGKPYVTKGVNIGYPNNLQIATKNMNQQFLNNTRLYMARNNLDKIPVDAENVIKNQNLRTNINGVMHGAQSNNVGWDSKTKTSPIFKNNLDALDVDFTKDTLFKKAGNVVKPILKYAGKTAIKLAAPFVPFLAPAAATLGALDVKEAHARGLTKPQELGAAYYLGPAAAEGMRNITDYDYKDRAGKEFENIKESWANLGTGSGEVIDDASEQMIGFKTGGSVEPRVEYREGTRMSPAKPKQKTYEELLREIQMEYNIPTDEGYMVKNKLGRLGDAVDVRNYPYYGSKALKGIMNATEFSLRFPGAAGQYIHDVATGPGWKEQGLDFIENVSPGWGWSEKVGLDSLIDEQVGNMKKRGSSDAPTSLGGLVELGTDIAMPLGYLYGAKKVGQFMKAVGKTPENISTLNKRILDHLDASGQSRRDFITMAGTIGTFGALKAMGLDKVLKISPAVKATDGLIPIVKGTSKMPEWFPLFIQKIQPKLIYEGDGISTFKGTDDFLPGIEVRKSGDDYMVSGTNAYEGSWNVNYEGPRWLEIEPGQKPTYFSGEFHVADDAPRMVDPDGGVDWDMVTHDEVGDILGGNGRTMEEFAKGTKIEGLTKGEKQVDWAEGRAQSAADEAREAEGGLTKLDENEWLGNYVDDRMPDDF